MSVAELTQEFGAGNGPKPVRVKRSHPHVAARAQRMIAGLWAGKTVAEVAAEERISRTLAYYTLRDAPGYREARSRQAPPPAVADVAAAAVRDPTPAAAEAVPAGSATATTSPDVLAQWQVLAGAQAAFIAAQAAELVRLTSRGHWGAA